MVIKTFHNTDFHFMDHKTQQVIQFWNNMRVNDRIYIFKWNTPFSALKKQANNKTIVSHKKIEIKIVKNNTFFSIEMQSPF